MNATALLTYFKPFDIYFAEANVSEICINKPQELWVEKCGHFNCYSAPELTLEYLWQLARLIAEFNERDISSESPTLSATLPNGARVQLVVPPACEKGSFVCAIRKPSVAQVSLHQYFSDQQKIIIAGEASPLSMSDRNLLALYHEKNYEAFLKAAVIAKKNIIISGGTSTGKTTFLNALLKYIPLHERLISIETDREVQCDHLNKVHLLAIDTGKSVAKCTMLDLLKANLRLRPDRILVSELRSDEAFPYLRAINSGHPGSLTTLHASSVEGCFEQLAFMVLQTGSSLTRAEIIAYAKSIVDVVVQITRDHNNHRYVSEIYFKEAIRGLTVESPSYNHFKQEMCV